MQPAVFLKVALVSSLLSLFGDMHSVAAWTLRSHQARTVLSRSHKSIIQSQLRLKSYNLNRSFVMNSSTRYLSNPSSSQSNIDDDDQSGLTNRLATELVNGQSSSTRPIRACIAIAGGGSHSTSAIASTPGASSLLLESVVTYDRRSFAEFVSQNSDLKETSGHSSDVSSTSNNGDGSFHFCSAQAAILLSRSALNRSLKLSPSFTDRCLNCVGVGSASSLVGLPSRNADDNERRRKRKSRAFVACSTLRDGTMVWEVELCNGLDVLNEQTLNHEHLHFNTEKTGTQERRNRSQEEAVVSNLILAAMLDDRESINNRAEETSNSLLTQILTREGDSINKKLISSNGSELAPREQSAASGARRIISGESNVVAVIPVQDSSSLEPNLRMEALYDDKQIPISSDVLIVPGSFNPPHIGHVQLANAAVSALQRLRQSEVDSNNPPLQSLHSMPSSVSSSSSVFNNIWNTVETTAIKQYDPTVLFEISVTNVDKPPIDPEEVERRINLFPSLERSELPNDWGVILTNAPLFSQKAAVLDNLIEDVVGARKMIFVIGTDTMVRIINPRYYSNSEANMVAALEDMKQKGVHFIVGGRLEQGTNEGPRFINGKEELEGLPLHVQEMFTLLEERDFRVDISSTELRKKLEAAHC